MARKNRLQISVPGWLVREENVIDETACSELTQGDSQAPEPQIPGMPSPNKVRGSFLHKVVSPNIKKSPAKMREKTPNSAKRKIMAGDDFQNDVFVVIKSPPPKTNPLTEHQIEIFREKRTLPAMYNTLDASQDVSLMAHFKSDDTRSQSQKTRPMINLLDKGKDIPCRSNQDDKLSPDEKKSEPRIHGKMNKNRKTKEAAPIRQTRSVRFSNETFEDRTSPDASQKDIGHFNVIKTMMQKIESPSTVTVNKSIESKPEEANNSLIGREENEIDSAHQLLSLSTPRISPTGKSTPTDSPVKDEEYQPSPLQRKLDSWLIRSPVRRREVELLPETFKGNVEKKQVKQGTSAKKQRGRKSVCLTEDTNSPVKRSRRVSDSCLRSTNDKNSAKLQKVTEEPSSKKKTAKTSAKKSLGEASFIQKDNLSTVVVPLVEETQSPKKLKQVSDCNDFVKPNVETRGKSCSKVEKPKVSPIIAVIEETQSPKKKIQCDTNSAVPILETPPRPHRSDLTAMSGNRKLFLSQDGEMIEHCEDSNIIPASPTSNKSMKLGTPVIKLKKLTQDEILQYSPSHKESKGEISSSTSTQKKRLGRPCKNSNLTSLSGPSSSKSSDKELAKLFLHEHDDFSDLRPILTEQTEELLSSGQTDERGGVSGDLPLSQGFDIGSNTSISKDNKISQGNGGENEILTKISSLSGSEALFTEQEPEEYDPCFESTLSDPTIKAKKSKLEKSSTSSTSMKNDDISKTQDKDAAETQQKMESEVYNPHLESTLASPPAFGSARKRKQKTPKKLSPESAGPSKRKRRRISQSSQLSDENSSRDELKEEMSSTSSQGDVSKNDRKKNTKEKISSQDIYKNEDEAKYLQSDIEIKDLKSGLLSSNVEDIDGTDMNLASHTSVVFSKDLGITNPVKSSSIIPPEVKIIVGNKVDGSIMKKRTLNKHSDDLKKSPLQTDDYIDIDFDESFTEMDPNKNMITLSDMKIDKTPESCSTINKQKMEKTPENRSIQDTPTRVSTTKKKKEVAQKRSLSKGKSSIPLDLDANLDPNECTSSSDKLVSLDLIKESEIENDMDILHSTEDVTENENSIERSNADLKVIPSKIGLCTPEKVNTRKTRNNELITEISEEYNDSVVIPETNEENIQEDISLDNKLSCNSSVTEDNSTLSKTDKNKKRNRKKPIQKELDNEIIGSQYEMVQTNQILSEHDSSEKHDKFDINYTSTIAEKVDNSCQNKGDNPVIAKDINLDNNSRSEMGDNCNLRTDNSSGSGKMGDNSNLQTENSSGSGKMGDNCNLQTDNSSGSGKMGDNCNLQTDNSSGSGKMGDNCNIQTDNSSGSGKESSSTDFFFAKEAEEMLEYSTNLKDTENKLDNRLSASLTSENDDDDIPLCDLISNKAVSETSPNSDAENRSDLKKQLSTIKRGRPKKNKQEKSKSSPLSQRLRSSKLTLRTRGIPIRKSAGGKLSLSNAKKIKHRNLSIKDLQEDNFEKDKVALTEIDKNIKSNDEVIVITSQSQDKEVTDHAFTEMVPKNKEASMVEDIAGPDNLKKFNDILQDETPRKAPDVTSTRKDLRFAERHTDSKLVVVPLKFEKRSNMARRSILKPTFQSLSLESPSQRKFQDFHPIKIGHVFAPSASPSAGILKRSRLSGEIATNSPSPPSKQRRVSFAEPVSVSKELLNQTSERPASPLVTSTSTVSSSLEEFFAASSESQKTDSLQSKKDSQMTQTQSSYTSTQQSQLDTTEAVYPDLTSCSISVDKILPQLTSSLWARGLGSLIKARNIHTIGDLSSLTEKQVDELPIRSPKVSVVRKVLKKYGEQTNSKQSKNGSMETNMKRDEGDKDEIQVTENKSSSTDLLDHVDSPDQEIQEILQTKESKKLYVDSDKNNTNTDTVADSGNERECVHSALTTTDNASIGDLKVYTSLLSGAPSQSAEKSDEKLDIKKTNIVSTLETLVEQCSGNKMKDVKTQDIFIIHQQLSKLTNTVVDTLKQRCTSPSDK